MKIDRVYVITMDMSDEYKDELFERVLNLPLPSNTPVEFKQGFPGKDLLERPEDFPEYRLYPHWNLNNPEGWWWWQRPALSGEAGGMISHTMCWEDAYENGYENIMIIEDDFTVEEPIDWGNDVWTLHSDLAKGKQLWKQSIAHYLEKTSSKDVIVAFSDKVNFRKYFVLSNYIGKFKRLFNPRYANEGDIHVWPDDHIEWDIIDEIMKQNSFQKVFQNDFLLYNSNYKNEMFNDYKDKVTDMRVTAYQKNT